MRKDFRTISHFYALQVSKQASNIDNSKGSCNPWNSGLVEHLEGVIWKVNQLLFFVLVLTRVRESPKDQTQKRNYTSQPVYMIK